MTDEADNGNEQFARWLESIIGQRLPADFDPGEPGECEHCGYEHPRLVRGLCPPFRDKLGED